MFFRILLWGLILYLLYKAISFLLGGTGNIPKFHKGGKSSRNIDIDKSEIEDADFREIKNSEGKS
ncbi:MAG: hypothetical protein KAV99_04445 [Candidatus Latescibacteria bacterium]|nr:hypothetical protein [Candidatus Latescibacterota bacterium]